MQTNLIFVGTHRRAHHADPHDIALGIYRFRPAADGALVATGMTETLQPGWIAVHPDGRSLYAANEVRAIDGEPGATVTAFAIDDRGALHPRNSVATPAMPCHCAVDVTGRFLAAATFGGGTVHLFELGADGSIAREADRHVHTGASVHPKRQTAPHAHGVTFDPANRHLLVPDLGTDQVWVYRFDAGSGVLTALPDRRITLPPGSGPRHLCFDSAGKFAYLINEISAAIAVFAYDSGPGILTFRESHALLPADFTGLRSGGEVGIRPDGLFLYATTRSHGSSGIPDDPGRDALHWFGIDPQNGILRSMGSVPSGGGIPRSFAFTPDGTMLFVGHQCSGSIVTFALDPVTGRPEPIATTRTPVPVCIAIVPQADR